MPRTEAQIAAEKARDAGWRTIQIRITPEEYALAEKWAGKRPVSGALRTLLRKAIKSPEA